MVISALLPVAATVLTLIVVWRQRLLGFEEGPVTDRDVLDSEYDFIVIGGGSAGSAIASRLSEVEKWSVLLLEAGSDEGAFSLVPLTTPVLANTKDDWAYRTEPSPHYCLAFNEGKCHWLSGKVLGGGSALNYMIYVRGNRRDYDIWEEMGAEGWGYEGVLPYYIKAEDNRDPKYWNKYHGRGGPLTVQSVVVKEELNQRFLNASQYMGYNVTDANGERQTGFMSGQYTIRDGSRCSAARAYLRPFHVQYRTNLHE